MTFWPEERVLKPLDPVPEDVNEWPDLALREVKIFPQGKARYADLLDASEETPLCVLGELMPLDDELEHLGMSRRRPLRSRFAPQKGLGTDDGSPYR